MRALRFDHFGDPHVLQVAELADPVAGDGQAVIAVKAASVNPSDVKNVVAATMTTVSKRDTPRNNGFQRTDGYHVVVFSSAAAAVPLRPTTIAHQLIDAIRVVGAALHRPPRADTTRSVASSVSSSGRSWNAKCADSKIISPRAMGGKNSPTNRCGWMAPTPIPP